MLATPELLAEVAQPHRLLAEISRCAVEVPLYRQRGEREEDYNSPTEFSHWPLITKADIRHGFPGNFLGTDTSVEDLVEQNLVELEHTSGTSEQRTPLILPKGWWAGQELRALQLNSFVASIFSDNPEAKRATINSPVCSGDIRYSGTPSRDDRIVGNSLFVSLSRYPFLWGPRDLRRMAEEIIEWEPVFLDVDPVYAVVFALYCERERIRLPSLKFIICSYEFVSVAHRAVLTRVFQVPVLDLYGSTETGHLLMEDESGQMRPSLDTAFFELINQDDSGVGDLVVTTLTNPFMPLIRYSIGDLVERCETPYGDCYIVHGRTADAFQVPSGRRVTTRQVDLCFQNVRGVAHYQLTQRPNGAWLLRFVPDGAPPEPESLRILGKDLAALLRSSSPIKVEQTDMLVSESSGKFRLGYPAKPA